MTQLPRERFLPFSRQGLVERIAAEFEQEDAAGFQAFARRLVALVHVDFHSQLDELERCYAPFHPDADVRDAAPDPEHIPALREELVDRLGEVLEAGNYERITRADLDRALTEESLLRIRLVADFDDFERVLFFRRGAQRRRETLKTWFGLRTREIEFTSYERVAVYLQFKEREHFEAKGVEPVLFEPGSTVLKLFMNVPEGDLEMLFPNTEVRMKPIDKVILGVPAAVGGMVLLVTKLGTTLFLAGSLVAFWLGLSERPRDFDDEALVALGLGLATVGGYLFRQVTKFKNRRIQFMKVLTESLYFRSLDSNAGVLHNLIDAAEDAECKEILLAYAFLLRGHGQAGEAGLDEAIERWFKESHGVDVDFDCDDALRKLDQLGLLTREQGTLRVPALTTARERLEELWMACASDPMPSILTR